jgi:Fic family protein
VSLKNAAFVPPHHEHVPELMGDLEKLLHAEEFFAHPLLRIAIAHYQFETIHPFLDGNGRIGRLLIIIYLIDQGILSKPILYLSEYFENYKSLYYDNLDRVREKNDMEQWLKFFLVAVIETSKKSISTLKAILELNKRIDNLIGNKLSTKSGNARKLISILYQKPRITSQQAAEKLDISTITAQRLIDDMVKLGILVEITGYKRNREYVFGQYLRLFSK